MRSDRTTRRTRTNIAFATIVLGAAMAASGIAMAPASASNHQVTICHATGNPGHYSMPSPTKAQIWADGGHKSGNEAAVHGDDIIPPFLAGSHGGQTWGDFAGLNWDATGQAIHGNGCVQPGNPPQGSTYLCDAATGVGETTATLNASTTDANATSATFTLVPGPVVLADTDKSDGFSVAATGLTADESYSYTVEFDPGDHPQSNTACEFTTDAAIPPPGAADLSASQQCAAGGLRITVANAGDADGVVDVVSGGVTVADDLTVPQAGSASVVVTVVEDTAYDIQVPGVASFTGVRDCVEVEGVVVTPTPTPTPAPTPAPAPSPAPAAPLTPGTAPVVAPVVVPSPQVESAVAARGELPRTGGDAVPMALLGLGLILLGAGAMVASRQEPVNA